jgi:hypothetical protein
MRKAAWVVACVSLLAWGVVPRSNAAETNLTGKWKMTSQTPRGERTSEITLLQEGEKLTVTSKDREGNDVKSEGTVKGADITWTIKRQTPMGEMVITYKGKIEGKSMAGTMEFGQGRSGEWKAERAE